MFGLRGSQWRWQPLRMADGGGGAGDDDEETLLTQRVDTLSSQSGGDAAKLALLAAQRERRLERDNKRLRDQLKAHEGKIIPDGAVVLEAKDAARWQAYQQLGEPDALSTQLTEAAKDRRAVAVAKVARAAGLDPDKLARLLPADAVPLIKTATVDGKQVEQPYVKHGDTETPLLEHENVAPFLAALNVSGQQEQGRFIPPMGAAGSATKTDRVAEASKRMQEQRDSRPNPLAPKT